MRRGFPDQADQGGGRLEFVACPHAIKCNHVIALIARAQGGAGGEAGAGGN
jgi:hypothetical protein